VVLHFRKTGSIEDVDEGIRLQEGIEEEKTSLPQVLTNT
jgi:hypothetical protein